MGRSRIGWAAAAAGVLIALATVITYANSRSTPFFFDDLPAIVTNQSIRHLGELGTVLSPPANGNSCVGRPLVNLSFALNYAFGGTAVWSYHAFNLAVHVAAALVLFGLLRRTLERLPGAPRSGRSWRETSLPAFAIALLWAVHPLQTESVTFVVQRTESLMGLFYLLTLYCFVRGASEHHETHENLHCGDILTTEATKRVRGFLCALGGANAWFVLSVLSCLLGMGCKEVMVTAPVMVLLYDRTFVAGSFGEAWCRRRGYYFALAATWILLAYLVINSGGDRGGAAGFGTGITWWTYALTQCKAIPHYLRLALWPRPLVVDYGNSVITDPMDVIPQALLLASLAGATACALLRKPAAGFVGAWFFLILAPSSSVVPLPTQTMAEHRMYLPLLSVIVAAVWLLKKRAGRWGFAACLVLAVGLASLSIRRNEDYRTDIGLWADTAAKCPGNERAHFNLANSLADVHRLPEAIAEYREAVRRRPSFTEAQNNLGNILYQLGRTQEAVDCFEAALRSDPRAAQAHFNLGQCMLRTGRIPEAITHYRAALEINPKLASAWLYWGMALGMTGSIDEALEHVMEAIRTEPGLLEAHSAAAALLTRLGRPADAVHHLGVIARAKPLSAEAHLYLAEGLLRAARPEPARREFEIALRLDPSCSQARAGLGRLSAAPR